MKLISVRKLMRVALVVHVAAHASPLEFIRGGHFRVVSTLRAVLRWLFRKP